MILTGKSAKDNWEILRSSDPDDTIFHLDDLSSPYVIIDQPMETLTKDQILECAQYCWSHSRHTHLKTVRVLFTPTDNTRMGKTVGEFVIVNPSKVNYKILKK
jgi:predicted ribosome quality control (RQC) complex YloA/Tae2 family protein